MVRKGLSANPKRVDHDRVDGGRHCGRCRVAAPSSKRGGALSDRGGRAGRHAERGDLRRVRGAHPCAAVRRGAGPRGGLSRTDALPRGKLREEGADALHHRPQDLPRPRGQGQGAAQQGSRTGPEGRARPETHPPALCAECRQPARSGQCDGRLRERDGQRADERSRPDAGGHGAGLHHRTVAHHGLYQRQQRRHWNPRGAGRQVAAGDHCQERYGAGRFQHDRYGLPAQQGAQ